MIDEYDDLERRCPQLGGPVPFKYCRTMNEKLPCRRVIECWGIKFDAPEWLSKNYTPEQVEQAFTPDTRTRIDKILEIAHEARSKKN